MQHPKCERAIRLVYPPLFCKLRSFTEPTKSNLTDLGPEILVANEWLYLDKRSELDTCSYELLPHNDRYYHLP